MAKKNASQPRRGLRLRSAPWVRQTRRERISSIKSRWGSNPANIQRYIEVMSQRPVSFSDKPVRDFLQKNADFFLEMLRSYDKQHKQRMFPAGWTQRLSQEEVTNAWRLADAYSKLHLREHFSRRLYSGLRDYLKARNYPVDNAVIEKVSLRFLSGAVDNPAQSIDWRAMERDYHAELKNRRRREQEDRTTTNIMVDYTVKGKRLTPNQFRNVKRWWRRNVEKYQKETDDALLHGYMDGKTEEVIRAEVDEIKQRYIIKAQLETFPKNPIEHEKLSRTVVAPSSPKKPGTRAERIAGHTPRFPSERAQKQMQRAEAEARAIREKFDPLLYSLTSLERENGSSGWIFKRFLDEKLLPEKLVIQLNAAGHLAQKAFTRVILTTRFRETFGDKSIASLARFFSRLKAYGVENNAAHRLFESSRGREMYDFLVREGLLDNTHDGGKKTYLVRLHD
ncbi:MAG: hypothetical protein FJY86_02750 [Candidatus Diapherotrites archaeon]|uniref:Uncharacterized protein n=1 Tax=Candidatus Iainarchaeum sp. TaxID=3101447 RepID=A0A8T4C6X6_9ARCH|nr:hypothetical protein [Candidatus Diapherotrites archaeon]